MGNFIITWRELFVGVAVLGVVFYIAEQLSIMLTGSSLLRRSRSFNFSAKEPMEGDLHQEIEQLRQRLAAVEERLAQQDAVDADVPSSPYLRAIQMARHGRDAESLSLSCGISRSEAELIVAMHSRRAG